MNFWLLIISQIKSILKFCLACHLFTKDNGFCRDTVPEILAHCFSMLLHLEAYKTSNNTLTLVRHLKTKLVLIMACPFVIQW